MDIKVSVIIPAYNSEKTLSAVLDSVEKQTLQDIEIIVVDDCSSDSTRDIISAAAEADGRIIPLFRQQNGGPAAARESAMDIARGQYISFVDADDFIEADMLEKMYTLGDGADIIVSGMYHDSLDELGNVAVTTENRTLRTETFTQKADIVRAAAELDNLRLYAFPANKLYRTEFMRRVGARFADQTLCEDFLMNCAIWDKAEKLTFVDGCYYHYIKSSSEALTQRHRDDYFDIMDGRFVAIRDLMQRNDLYSGEIKIWLCNIHLKHLVAGMSRLFNPGAKLTVGKRRRIIKSILTMPNCREAAKYAKSTKKQEMVCNLLVKSRSVTLCYLFAKLLRKMQTGSGKLFDKMK